MPSVDTQFRRDLTTQTDVWTVTFFPPAQCKECVKEFVNRKGLRRHKLCSHKCVREGELPRQPTESRSCEFKQNAFWRAPSLRTWINELRSNSKGCLQPGCNSGHSGPNARFLRSSFASKKNNSVSGPQSRATFHFCAVVRISRTSFAERKSRIVIHKGLSIA